MDGEKREVMTLNKFGLCPICGKPMVMMESHFTMFALIQTGKYPNKVLKREQDIEYACECGYRAKMTMTPDGIYPKDYHNLDVIETNAIKRVSNPIGKISEEEK